MFNPNVKVYRGSTYLGWDGQKCFTRCEVNMDDWHPEKIAQAYEYVSDRQFGKIGYLEASCEGKA